MPEDLRALRQKKRLRQRDVAARIGLSEYQIRKWERGLVLPPPQIIEKFAEFYGVPFSALDHAQRALKASATTGEGYTTGQAQYSGIEHPRSSATPNGMRVLDLFCGAGGISFGLELTGQYTVVAGLDLLPDRIASFCANHPHATGIVGDIQGISENRLTEISSGVDMIVGGPPCQGFSSIRPFRTLTELDQRNTLIEHFVKAVAIIRPRWFIFENVLGILSHRRGVVLKTLIDGFQACGYKVSWRIINSALFGVPQNRERLIILGNRTGAKFRWPKPSHSSNYKSMAGRRAEAIRYEPLFSTHIPKAVTLMEAIGDLPEIEAGKSADFYRQPPQNQFQEWVRDGNELLTMHQATKHSDRMLSIISHAGSNISAIPDELISSGFSTSYSRLDADKPSTTLTVNFVHPASNRCIHPLQDRALTPREGARIQSFPDSFRFCGTRSQIVKQIGNAVPPLLAKSLGKAISDAEG